MSREREVCVIGAGISGIAACRGLQRAGIPFVCYEAGSQAGGLWWIDNDNGMSNIYASLSTNTSSSRTGFLERPMPASSPAFPRHADVLEYLNDFIDHFGFSDHIQTGHRVLEVSKAGGSYTVRVRPPDGSEKKRTFDAVVVCNGHHWKPFKPELPGSYDGRWLHSSDYREPGGFAGERVLVVGAGNSACDIAVDLSGSAEVHLSTRSGAYVIPRHLLGRPLDLWTSDAASRLPIAVQRALFRMLVFLTVGPQRRYGFPIPDVPFLTSHPTISSTLLPAVGDGRIKPRPGIASVEGRVVRFEDGEETSFDTIIMATGYSVSFPFLDDDMVAVDDNSVQLYRHVVHPDHPNLFFVGLVQPLGALAPLAEAQSKWVADLLSGRVELPPREAMLRAIDQDSRLRDRRFVDSRRHTLEVEFFGYLRQLKSASA